MSDYAHNPNDKRQRLEPVAALSLPPDDAACVALERIGDALEALGYEFICASQEVVAPLPIGAHRVRSHRTLDDIGQLLAIPTGRFGLQFADDGYQWSIAGTVEELAAFVDEHLPSPEALRLYFTGDIPNGPDAWGDILIAHLPYHAANHERDAAYIARLRAEGVEF
jgi:hypothetical protein